MPSLSKCRRRIDPQHPRFFAAGILPTVRRRAFEIKAVAGLQPVIFALVEPDLKFSPKQMEKFLPFVGVGFTAPATRLHSEEVWLYCRVTPGKQFHADIRSGFQDFSFGRAHQ